MRRKLRACERFVRAAHRRMVLMRAIEGAGIGAGIASALAAVLVIVLIIEEKAGWDVAGGILVLGGVVGFIWGVIRRPTELDTAAEADRQLHLDDLLGTTLLVLRQGGTDEWGRSVAAMADAACARLSPNMLAMNRLGARGWGGIGISAALLMTLGVMSSLPGNSEARDVAAGRAEQVARVGAEKSHEKPGGQQVGQGPRGKTGESWQERAAVDAESTKDSRERSDGKNGLAARAGEGSASGRTNDLAAESLTSQTRSGSLWKDGESGLAGGGGTSEMGAGEGVGSAGTASADSAAPTPPWRHDDWSRRRKAALDAAKSGRIPDRYAPVIREYFDQAVK